MHAGSRCPASGQTRRTAIDAGCSRDAGESGLRAGDVITTIDGEQVEDLGMLRRRLSALDPGASFAIAIMRDGAAMSLPAELADEAQRRPRGPRRGTRI